MIIVIYGLQHYLMQMLAIEMVINVFMGVVFYEVVAIVTMEEVNYFPLRSSTYAANYSICVL